MLDHLDDAAFLARFERLEIPARDFGHREHLRLAFVMLRDADFGEGAVRFRAAFRRFTEAFGVTAKYHETLTWAYLALVAQCIDERVYASSLALLADRPDLLDHQAGLLARHYDVAAITASPLARRVFVLPARVR
ncbi:MAG: hypothetical protein ABI678_06240 [Kofleriaceae bacterium]